MNCEVCKREIQLGETYHNTLRQELGGVTAEIICDECFRKQEAKK